MTNRLGLLVCFFLSGTAALIYEVLWTRMLVLIVGGTRPAVSTALAAFMAGLAAGSAFAGRRVDASARPLRLYAWLEAGIAIFGAASPWIFEAIERLEAPAVRFGLSFLALAAPAALMGATFPAMLRIAAGSPEHVGRTVARLYAINTFGGVAGCLGAGFLLIPAFGMTVSGFIAACLNGFVAFVCLNSEEPPRASAPDTAPAGSAKGLPAIAAAVGFLSLGFEVVWTRILVMLLGGSVYAFSLMLAAFLTGIAVGGFLVSFRADRWKDLARVVGAAQLAVALLTFAWMSLLAFPFTWVAGLRESVGDSFVVFSAARFALTFAILAAVTVPMGMTLPLLVKMAHRRFPDLGREAGGLYAANTLGAVAGSLAVGLAVLPAAGMHKTLVGLSAGCALLAAVVWFPRRLLAAAAFAVAFAGLLVPTMNPALLNSGAFAYSKRIRQAGMAAYLAPRKTLFFREGVNATVAVSEDLQGRRSLQINGKTDGGITDDETLLMTGYLPMLMHPAPERVLVIGYGVGGSLGAVTTFADPKRIVCVEIEPAVLEAAHFFAEHYHRPLADPRVTAVVADARRYCRSTVEKFDLIISEPSNPWLTGVSNLFTVEFFRSLRERLAPGGMMCVWVPFYHMDPDDVRLVLRTVREAFPSVTLWEATRSDGLLIAPAEGSLTVPFARVRAVLKENGRFQEDLKRMPALKGTDLLERILADAGGVKEFAGSGALNTDDHPILEFGAARHGPSGNFSGSVYAALADYYTGRRAEDPFHVELAVERATGEPAGRFDYLDLDCRPGGRDPQVVFYGLNRRFIEKLLPTGDGVDVIGGSIRVLRMTWDSVPAEVRAFQASQEPGNTIDSAALEMGVADPRVLTIGGHEAVWGAAARHAVLVWRCDNNGLKYEAVVGPLDREPREGDVRGLNLQCIH